MKMPKNEDPDLLAELQLPVLRLRPHDIIVFRSNVFRTVSHIRRMRRAIQEALVMAQIDFPVGILYLARGIEIGLQPEPEVPTPSSRITQDTGNESPSHDRQKAETYLLRESAIDQLIHSHQQQREIVGEDADRHRRMHQRFRWLPLRVRCWLQGN